MIKITLKDGSIKDVEKGSLAIEVVKGISEGLARAALAVGLNGKVYDLNTTIEEDCTFTVYTFDDQEGKDALRHTASHVLAQAVKRLFPM